MKRIGLFFLMVAMTIVFTPGRIEAQSGAQKAKCNNVRVQYNKNKVGCNRYRNANSKNACLRSSHTRAMSQYRSYRCPGTLPAPHFSSHRGNPNLSKKAALLRRTRARYRYFRMRRCARYRGYLIRAVRSCYRHNGPTYNRCITYRTRNFKGRLARMRCPSSYSNVFAYLKKNNDRRVYRPRRRYSYYKRAQYNAARRRALICNRAKRSFRRSALRCHRYRVPAQHNRCMANVRRNAGRYMARYRCPGGVAGLKLPERRLVRYKRRYNPSYRRYAYIQKRNRRMCARVMAHARFRARRCLSHKNPGTRQRCFNYYRAYTARYAARYNCRPHVNNLLSKFRTQFGGNKRPMHAAHRNQAHCNSLRSGYHSSMNRCRGIRATNNRNSCYKNNHNRFRKMAVSRRCGHVIPSDYRRQYR